MNNNLSRAANLFAVLTILITPGWLIRAIAQENSNPSSNPTFKVTFKPPTVDQPKTSKGAASRCIGQCNNENQAENSSLPLVPLIPASTKGLTVSSHPTVLVYFSSNSASLVLFSWRNEDSSDHYQTILPLNNQSGVISLTLPDDAPPLEVGKNYQWALAIIPNGKLKPDTPTIEGQIQRVALEATTRDRLQTANSLETVVIYGEAGIWYETVATLAKLRKAAPDDHNLASNWQNLLASVGLEKIAQIPSDSSDFHLK
ncbi:DUF928 domain-containing protein [Xenococcus sp. PCC 7305]|uniref:DUF928 domain-containing protein n=1 Tax=Xenococcus sp. PCC 7305 TaxID=102125 RepID=UPI000593F81D|nr:DUF928 domain-containing protein [Xenococcus sp. PCC 7305]